MMMTKSDPRHKRWLIKCNGNGTSGFYVLSNGTKHTGMNGASATFGLVYHLNCFKQGCVSQSINVFYGWIYWIKTHRGDREETQCDHVAEICNLCTEISCSWGVLDKGWSEPHYLSAFTCRPLFTFHKHLHWMMKSIPFMILINCLLHFIT